MNNKAFTTLKSDSYGHIFIPSSVTPPTNYKLKVSDAQGNFITETDTNQFISQNNSYLNKNRINLYDTATANKIETDQKFRQSLAAQKPSYSQNLPSSEEIQDNNQNTNSSSSVFVILTVVIALSLGALSLFMYKIKTNSHQ
jgi:hypothetical protein